jgi:DNA-binding MarR family transcriptional regulator
MRMYHFIEIILKQEIKEPFTITDVCRYIENKKRLDIDRSYISKLFKQLERKKIIKVVRRENLEKGFFAKKLYKLIDKKKWEEMFV